jgi:hypothetical protein
MPLDLVTFQQQFIRFEVRILHNSDTAFVSFHEGLPATWESYKVPLRTIARDRLGFGQWCSTDVGTGRILERVIEAIEISDRPDVPRNNLVAWQARYGPQSQSHRALLAVRGDRSARRRLEQWCVDFFQGRSPDADAFEAFVGMAGQRYDLVAYLFFLKDSDRFMPIAPTTFDSAFSNLGIALKTSRHCSWDNYSQYNAALGDVRDALRDISGISDARLIDAHSFCWMLVRLKLDDPKAVEPVIPMPVSLTDLKPPLATSRRGAPDKTAPVVSDDDFMARDAAQRRLGRMAEAIAFGSEQKRLLGLGRPDLAGTVKLVSDQPALGYDIQSFEHDGRPRHIEVKAARQSGRRLVFFMTRNELAQCRALMNYHFYLVLDAGSTHPTVFTVQAADVQADCLAPINYLATLDRTD